MSCRSRLAGGADFRATIPSTRAARRHKADIDVAEIVMLERFDLRVRSPYETSTHICGVAASARRRQPGI